MHTLHVLQKDVITAESAVLHFEIPTELRDEFRYTSGQYITLEATIAGEAVRRAYSLCSAPHEEKMSIGVKCVEGGKMSNYLVKELKAGDPIQVMKPQGKFVLTTEAEKTRSHYFFAAGSGITPVLSMIKSVLESEARSTCYLLYGNRKLEDVMFKAELDQLADYYKDQLIIEYSLTQPEKEKKSGLSGLLGGKKLLWGGKVGRIDGPMIKNFVQEHEGRRIEKHYYVCGPGRMIEQCERSLAAIGVDSKSIHKEYFTSSSGTNSAEKVMSGDTKTLHVKLDGEEFDVEMTDDQNIVDALLEIKKEVPYSCTAGACSTCIAKVTSGEVKMETCLALDEDELAEGYILTCQAHLVTDEVSVDFDV